MLLSTHGASLLKVKWSNFSFWIVRQNFAKDTLLARQNFVRDTLLAMQNFVRDTLLVLQTAVAESRQPPYLGPVQVYSVQRNWLVISPAFLIYRGLMTNSCIYCIRLYTLPSILNSILFKEILRGYNFLSSPWSILFRNIFKKQKLRILFVLFDKKNIRNIFVWFSVIYVSYFIF